MSDKNISLQNEKNNDILNMDLDTMVLEIINLRKEVKKLKSFRKNVKIVFESIGLYTNKDVINYIGKIKNQDNQNNVNVTRPNPLYPVTIESRESIKESIPLKNNINIEKDENYIRLLNKNKKLEENMEKLNSELNNTNINDKIQDALNKQKLEYETKIEEMDKKLKNLNKNNPISPSVLNNVKKDTILKLPENLIEVVYNRNFYKDKYCYVFGLQYRLNCCNIINEDYDFKKDKNITCTKCFRTYNFKEKYKSADKHDALNVIILPEHVIKNEKEIYNKIKCNNCNHISNKEIELCFKCKNLESCKPIVTKMPDNNTGIKTIKVFASETYKDVIFNANIYETARKEGIDVFTMKPLVEFIKKNNLLKEKQPNIIIRKITRSGFILNIYNDEKYKNIQDIIKRIYFNLNYISKLDDKMFSSFKTWLINILDEEIKKVDINNNEDTLSNNMNIEDDKKGKNNNNFKKLKCKKCKNILSENDNMLFCIDCIDNHITDNINCICCKKESDTYTPGFCEDHYEKNILYKD